jgi:hypothetical protein
MLHIQLLHWHLELFHENFMLLVLKEEEKSSKDVNATEQMPSKKVRLNHNACLLLVPSRRPQNLQEKY